MKKLFKKLALMVVALLTFSVGSNYTVKEVKAADTEVVFNLGAIGSASHNDGSTKSTYTETVDGYTLNITGGTNMYTGARDAKGNSCIKMGASSKAGSFKFTVPDDVTSVVIFAGKYKANTTKLTVNGTTKTLTKNSNDGAYDEITVDTTSNKTITATTVSGGYRCMVNTITYIIADNGGSSEPDITPSVNITGETYTEIGKTIKLTATTTNFEGTVSWTSSNNAVATVAADGTVTAKAMGTTTITATADTAKATYEIKVYPVANSIITIAEALTVCDLTGANNAPFKYSVKGTIKQNSLSYDSEFSSYTCDIFDNSGEIKAYGIKGEGALVEEANITITGSLVTFNGVKEFTYDSTYTINSVDYISAIKSLSTEASLGFDFTYEQKEVPTTAKESTLTFDDTSKRTEFSTSKQKWEENGVVFTNEKTANSSNVGDYSKPIRLYKNSIINIEVEASISKIVFDSANGEHLTNFKNSLTDIEYTENANLITIELDGTSNIYSLVLSGGQVRLNSITVTYGGPGVTTTVEDYSESTFDNISILFGIEINETYNEVFKSFNRVTAGVKFESEGDFLFDCQVEINSENGYSVGVVFEVVPDKTTLSDEIIKERLNTVIKATVYFVVDGTIVELNPSEVSVKSMVETYTTDDDYTSNATVQKYAGALNALKTYIG